MNLLRTLLVGNIVFVGLIAAGHRRAAPGTVADLAVALAGDTSVTLAWTGIASGDTSVAHYDVRQALGTFTAATFPWGGGGASVKSGSCAGNRVAGTRAAGGERVTCTVGRLAPSTAYSFELVAYTGTLNVNAVFGPLSNVANATTTAAAVPVVARVVVSLAQVTLFVGQSVQLGATLQDANGAALAGSVTWGVSGPVSVTSTGALTAQVTALSAGTGTVTATSLNGVKGTSTVTVALVPVRLLTITPALDTLAVGQSVQLVATTLDSAGHVLTGRPVTWSTSTPTVTSVSPQGLVGALAPGFGQVSASSSGITSTAAIVVPSPTPPSVVAVVRLDGFTIGSLTLLLGQAHQFQAIPVDAAGNVLQVPIAWRASAPAVATVDANGFVKAVGPGLGQDTVSATAPNGVRAWFLVNVPFNLPLNCGVAIPPPVGCGLRSGTWSLMGIDTANGIYGPWFQLDTLGQKRKTVRVVVSDTTP